ncbi:DUF6227 family protein [Streptomyces sp. NPDC054784]
MGETPDAVPGRHLEMLLARAQNPFDVSDRALLRLADAVLCQVELQGWQHRNAPPPSRRCSTYRHAFLLSDGSTLSLWELRHETGDGAGRASYEIYEYETSLRRSQERVSREMDAAGGDPAETSDGGLPDVPDVPDGLDAYGLFEPNGTAGAGSSGVGFREFLSFAGGAARRRAYLQRDSPDHARRLLRRAENVDRPGEDTLRLLSTACGHEIAHVPKPHAALTPCHVWCSVYEHAFLLADGREVSLYELEHNLTRGGRLVCEVYLEEAVAEQAARRRARDRGLDL